MSLIEKALIKSKSQSRPLKDSSLPLAGPRMEHVLGDTRRSRPRTALMAWLCVLCLVAIGVAWFLISYAPDVAQVLKDTTQRTSKEDLKPPSPSSMTRELAGPEPLHEAQAPLTPGTEPSTGQRPDPLPTRDDGGQGPPARLVAGPAEVQPEAPERPSPSPGASRTAAASDGRSGPRKKATEDGQGRALPSAPSKPSPASEDRRQVLLEKAFLNGQAGNIGSAIQIYTEVLREEADCFEALLNRGILRERSGDHLGAKADLLLAKELRPQDPVLLNALGVLYLSLDEPDQAAIYLKMAAEPFSMINLALLYWRRGERDRALGCLDEAQMKNPHDPHVPYYKGILLSQQGHHREAQQEMDRAAILARKRGEMDLLRRLEAISLRP